MIKSTIWEPWRDALAVVNIFMNLSKKTTFICKSVMRHAFSFSFCSAYLSSNDDPMASCGTWDLH